MRTVLQDNPCYELSMEVNPIDKMEDLNQVRIIRRWRMSNKPTENHVELDLMMTSEEIGRIKRFLDSI